MNVIDPNFGVKSEYDHDLFFDVNPGSDIDPFFDVNPEYDSSHWKIVILLWNSTQEMI